MEREIVGVSGPRTRICVVARESDARGIAGGPVACYAMELSAFDVIAKEGDELPKYDVVLSGATKDGEHLVVGETLLDREHNHRLPLEHEAPPGFSDPIFRSDCPQSKFCAVGSDIYCVSFCSDSRHEHGEKTLLTRVRYDEGKGVWVAMRRASALCRRTGPNVLCADGKLILFGGIVGGVQYFVEGDEDGADVVYDEEGERKNPWSEVYDPRTNTWEVLTIKPPSHFIGNDGGDYYQNAVGSRIWIVSRGEDIVFEYEDGGWKKAFTKDWLWTITKQPVIVGTEFYWADFKINAHDFETNKYSDCYYPSYELDDLLVTDGEEHEVVRLVHIGGGEIDDLFCLVWWSRTDYFHFTRFRVLHSDVDGMLHPSMISCSAKVAQEFKHLEDVLLLDGQFGEKMLAKVESALEKLSLEPEVTPPLAAHQYEVASGSDEDEDAPGSDQDEDASDADQNEEA